MRRENFSSYSFARVFLREGMKSDVAREILGASCATQDDKSKVWFVKMPDFQESNWRDTSLVSPSLHELNDQESDLNEYMDDPLDPVLCMPDQNHDHYWRLLNSSTESMLSGTGSTMNFWQLSAHSERLTLGVRMHSTAAFLSMPNKDGVVVGGKMIRGFNDNSMRGYPLRLPLTTRQVTDVVMYDEDILRAKVGRQVPDDMDAILDPEVKKEEVRRICSLRYLDGYPDTKVIDPIKENYPACTMPLSSTSPTHVTPQIMRNQQYAQEYITHVALIRDLLNQASLSINPVLLEKSPNKLLQSLSETSQRIFEMRIN